MRTWGTFRACVYTDVWDAHAIVTEAVVTVPCDCERLLETWVGLEDCPGYIETTHVSIGVDVRGSVVVRALVGAEWMDVTSRLPTAERERFGGMIHDDA